MNQILDYNPNKGSSGGGSSKSDKIVRVFAVLMGIFGLFLLGNAAYSLYKNNQQSATVEQAPAKASIVVEQGETKAIIKVSHDKAIEKVIYSWDTDKETTEKGNGESSMEIEVALAAGEHTLNIKVIDIDGVESKHEEVLVSETGEDKVYPVITLEVTSDKKVRVTATDETELSYVTYRWNDEVETEVPVSDDNKKIEFDIDINKGTHDLTVSAVDKNNNTTTEIKSFNGVTKPEVKVTVSADKKSIDVYSSHENGIKEIKLNINGQDYDVGIPADSPKEVSFNVALPSGNNVIKVTAISVEQTDTTVEETVTAAEDEITISIEQQPDVADKALIKALCDAGIRDIKLNVNDIDYNLTIDATDPKELSFELPLVEGNNKITFTVISVNGTEKQEVKEIVR
ncbi:MAG: hypothetical protein IKJ36_00125 [Clostridia bacterium]|nr:hypothetical protein [Clostridia bacterium]